MPLTILLITNSNNRRTKEIEKKLELDFKSKDDLRQQEKKVYASLSEVLFDIQQLHVSLSENCTDKNCITDALAQFKTSVNKYHTEIANNMLYLSSNTINRIYEFYFEFGQLELELRELDKKGEYETANVSVYKQAQILADIVIEIQGTFTSKRDDLKIEFSKVQQEKMRYHCGTEPPKELINKYESLKLELIKNKVITADQLKNLA